MRLSSLICALALLSSCQDPAMAQGVVLTASWYSSASLRQEGTWAYSQGRMADGQQFDENALTCAARLWPLGARVRVTNLETNESIVVKVTDRIGKRFARRRIDLSKGAFSRIAKLKQGLIKVRVEEL